MPPIFALIVPAAWGVFPSSGVVVEGTSEERSGSFLETWVCEVLSSCAATITRCTFDPFSDT